MEKQKVVLEEGMVIDGKVVDKIVKWQIYFDSETMQPVGQGFSAYCAAPEEKLPALAISRPWIQIREATLVVFKKKRRK